MVRLDEFGSRIRNQILFEGMGTCRRSDLEVNDLRRTEIKRPPIGIAVPWGFERKIKSSVKWAGNALQSPLSTLKCV